MVVVISVEIGHFSRACLRNKMPMLNENKFLTDEEDENEELVLECEPMLQPYLLI